MNEKRLTFVAGLQFYKNSLHFEHTESKLRFAAPEPTETSEQIKQS